MGDRGYPSEMLWFGHGRPLGYAATMPTLRWIALGLVTCSTAALAIACGGDDVAAVPDAGNDVTTPDTGTDDTGTTDTGTTDTGTTDGGTDGSAPTGIQCTPTNCTSGSEACCAPKGGTTDTCKAVPDGGFVRICAGNESEFRCSTSDSCGGGNSRCCARLPKQSNNDGGPQYLATCTTTGCLTSGQSFAFTLCTPNGSIGCGDAGTCKPLPQVDGGPGIPAGYYACQP